MLGKLRHKQSAAGVPRIVAFLFAQVLLIALFGALVTWWVNDNDPPVQSDVIVVLAGNDFYRPLFAAELYAKGYAREIWLSRPKGNSGEDILAPLGIHYPPEDEINRDVLLKKGVPPGKIHLYGHDLRSTADEAGTLSKLLPPEAKTILVVTSRPHTRRALLIFRHYFPQAHVYATGTPYDPTTLKWWKDQNLARNGILEILKTAYFLMGGRFLANPT